MKKTLLAVLGIMAIMIFTGCPTPSDPTPGSEKAITAFSFTNLAVTGVIEGTTITVTVPYGTDITALAATFATTGASVKVGSTTQVSGSTANNFTSSVIYTVTAEDSSEQDYTVTVTVAAAAEGSGFSTAANPGDTGILTLSESALTLTMIYANNSTSITFPTETDDTGTAILTTKFFMAETEVTNAVMAVVLQWAYDDGRFSSTVGDHNGLDATTAKHGNQELLDLNDIDCRVDYDGSGSFSAEIGYWNNPVTNVTWYGSVMFCNWLTEMRDGNTANVVYTDIDTDWIDDETTETVTKTGYRLPSSDECEYAARYRGTDSTNYVSGYADPYYTQGDSASGAIADYTDVPACQAVAVYSGSNPVPSDEAAVKSLAANALGLYDMSGNVWEWCFTEYGSDRMIRRGSWNDSAFSLQVGYWDRFSPDFGGRSLGFRLCRTAND